MPRLSPTLAAAALLAVAGPALAQNIRAQRVAQSVVLSSPLDAAAPATDFDRLFIVEQGGKIRILNLAPNTVNATPFIDLGTSGKNIISSGGERGLLGLAFHPDYANNGYFYVNYTRIGDGATVIARYRANAPYATATTADADSGLIMKTYAQPFSNHNGGHLAFGPDGMLYCSSGDGGSGGDPNENAQNKSLLLGKILRLDVNNEAGAFIPADNPFVGVPGAAPEIWAYGVRNPWRIAFDRFTGDFWIGDVGQDTREEVDFQPALTPQNYAQVAGRNYGWDCREGKAPASSLTDVGCDPNDPTLVDPVFDYPNQSNFCSVTGGVVYRGSAIPSLWGTYFYADYCANIIRSFKYDGVSVFDQKDFSDDFSQPTGAIASIVGFAQDSSGEVYIIGIGGQVYKIVPDTTCGCPCILAGSEPTILTENFQVGAGWTVSGAATAGAWQRGTPVNDTSYAFDPISDSDGSGAAYVTGNTTGATSDLDGGSTILTSPAIDLSSGDFAICFDYYLYLSVPAGNDGLTLEISPSGPAGPWTQITRYNASNGLRWTPATISANQIAGLGLTFSADSRIRFTASDISPDSTVEAGIDNLRIYRTCLADFNKDSFTDAIDYDQFITAWLNGQPESDINADGFPDALDYDIFIRSFFSGC